VEISILWADMTGQMEIASKRARARESERERERARESERERDPSGDNERPIERERDSQTAETSRQMKVRVCGGLNARIEQEPGTLSTQHIPL
jgi:hypothetical protein